MTSDIDIARKIALDKLSHSDKSRADLDEAMARKNVPKEARTHVLDRLVESGLVDDRRFAFAWVESRQRTKGLAPRVLRQELKRHGIDDELIDESLALIDREDEYEAARRLVAKKLRSMNALEPAVKTRRLLGLLARKGYDGALAGRVVRSEVAGADDLMSD